MPLLPTARAVEAYTLRNAEDFAYMKDVAYRTGGFGLGLGLVLGLLLSSFFCCTVARCNGRLFTAGDLGPGILARLQRRWQQRRLRRDAKRASAEARKGRALEIELAEGGGGLSGTREDGGAGGGSAATGDSGEGEDESEAEA